MLITALSVTSRPDLMLLYSRQHSAGPKSKRAMAAAAAIALTSGSLGSREDDGRLSNASGASRSDDGFDEGTVGGSLTGGGSAGMVTTTIQSESPSFR